MYGHLDKLEKNLGSRKDPGVSSKDDEVAPEVPYEPTCETICSVTGECKPDYIQSLRDRISRVCKGHSIWLEKAERFQTGFGANYWVTGNAIETSEGWLTDALGKSSLTDTPFQLIKLADFGEVFKLEKDATFSKKLRTLVKDWVKEIDNINTRGFYAFPHPKKDHTTLQEFRLDDHVWIWRTLQSVKHFGLGNDPEDVPRPLKGRQRETADTVSKRITQELNLDRDYSPAVFRKHVLRRFTTENPVSKQRMLAVARSPSESRFYLHSRDTALFYKENLSFFAKYEALKEATMDVQKFHEESEGSTWGNPLRYALAIMRGGRLGRLDERQTDNLFKTAKDFLLQISSANGLFPGALDPVTKEPECFLDEMWRDAYWHRTFEIPYILWQWRDFTPPPSDPSPGGAKITLEPPAVPPALDSTFTQTEMKRWMPFNNVIVQQSIVELSDEWLYRFPTFLDLPRPKEDSMMHIDADPTLRGVIIDIPKTARDKKDKDPMSSIELLCNERMYERLAKARTAQSSKKRLIWITNANTVTGKICSQTSDKSETDSLDQFFKRHDGNVRYFSDEVTATANLWATEMRKCSSERPARGSGSSETFSIATGLAMFSRPS